MAEFTEVVKDYFTNAEIDKAALMKKLSEFLAVEEGGQKLYEKALTLVIDSEVRSKFREFLQQTRDHQKKLTQIIKQLGGNPRTKSPTAQVATAKAEALLKAMGLRALSKQENELNAMENIVLAETKDHADWELLGKIARQTTDAQLRKALKDAVNTVEEQEDEHLNWTKKKLAELEMIALNSEMPEEQEHEEHRARNAGSRNGHSANGRSSMGRSSSKTKKSAKPARARARKSKV
jgi:rubrerythrin